MSAVTKLEKLESTFKRIQEAYDKLKVEYLKNKQNLLDEINK